MVNDEENNLAFIDGQNLYRGIDDSWKIDLKKFRIYLNKKYKIEKAYYFLGFLDEDYQYLYDRIQEAGFILKFREHNSMMEGKKKGNVDTNIIFDVMEKICEGIKFNKVLIVAGDGDYKILVDFLIRKARFKKILFPSKESASSLYKELGSEYFDYLDNESIKNKIKKAP
jgi:uncharacterized LabA/DUF88 family protein